MAPSGHVWSYPDPQFWYQEPPGAQQLTLPFFGLEPQVVQTEDAGGREVASVVVTIWAREDSSFVAATA